jgi:hypothetical protein
VANGGSGTIGVLLGYGNGNFAPQMAFSSSSPYAIAVSDFNGDGRLDIAVGNWGGTLGVFLGYGNGSFAAQMTFSSGGSGPFSVVIGDFNNDNRMDVVMPNSITGNVAILLGYGTGNFSAPTTYSTGSSSNPYAVAVGDFNRDTFLDVAYALNGANQIGIMLGYGNGAFAPAVTYSTGSISSPYAMSAADFNQDSRIDLAVANLNGGNVGVFLGYGNGTMASQVTYSLGGTPYYVTTADFNQDTKPDIAVPLLIAGRIGILLNTC